MNLHNETQTIPACAGCMVKRARPTATVHSVTPWKIVDASTCNCGRSDCAVSKGEIVSSKVAISDGDNSSIVIVDYHPVLGGRMYIGRAEN